MALWFGALEEILLLCCLASTLVLSPGWPWAGAGARVAFEANALVWGYESKAHALRCLLGAATPCPCLKKNCFFFFCFSSDWTCLRSDMSKRWAKGCTQGRPMHMIPASVVFYIPGQPTEAWEHCFGDFFENFPERATGCARIFFERSSSCLYSAGLACGVWILWSLPIWSSARKLGLDFLNRAAGTWFISGSLYPNIGQIGKKGLGPGHISSFSWHAWSSWWSTCFIALCNFVVCRLRTQFLKALNDPLSRVSEAVVQFLAQPFISTYPRWSLLCL